MEEKERVKYSTERMRTRENCRKKKETDTTPRNSYDGRISLETKL